MTAADRAIGQLYGPPNLGESSQTVVDATDKTVTVKSGRMVFIVAMNGDVIFALNGSALTAANQAIVPSGSSAAFMVPGDGAPHVLHLTQGPATGGTAYVYQTA